GGDATASSLPGAWRTSRSSPRCRLPADTRQRSCKVACQPPNREPWYASWLTPRPETACWSSAPLGSSVKAATHQHSTPCSSPDPSHSMGCSSNAPAESRAPPPARTSPRSTTTMTKPHPSSPLHYNAACPDTVPSASPQPETSAPGPDKIRRLAVQRHSLEDR